MELEMEFIRKLPSPQELKMEHLWIRAFIRSKRVGIRKSGTS